MPALAGNRGPPKETDLLTKVRSTTRSADFYGCKGCSFDPVRNLFIRRYTTQIVEKASDGRSRCVSPHVWRHTTVVHLLEAGVEVNVIRAWLGHATLETTNRYAEIIIRTKQAALEKCIVPGAAEREDFAEARVADRYGATELAPVTLTLCGPKNRAPLESGYIPLARPHNGGRHITWIISWPAI
jgi:hypothetical protein